MPKLKNKTVYVSVHLENTDEYVEGLLKLLLEAYTALNYEYGIIWTMHELIRHFTEDRLGY
jgi:hypothetical protein